MTRVIDVNCDMGESFGAYAMGSDEEVIRSISSASIACGFHAADPMVMDRTIRLCRDHQVGVGAHPGYPDMMGFGRRFMEITPLERKNYVVYQVGALQGFLSLYGIHLQHIKLHGALYNDLVAKPDLFYQLIGQISKAFGDPIFLTLATKQAARMKDTARREGLRIALEAFPDRQYTDEGELVPRSQVGVVLKDPELIAKRAVAMVVDKGFESIKGRWIDVVVDTLCIHGDNPVSVAAGRMIVDAFKREGIIIKPLGEIIPQ
ncbi:MAG: lactam utilization protein LamB [Deltaproteobacteria bacterium HGW-Deltaproteobacteria-10]|nr:MAG: lactam utilization protein LamB [Deltaproteobacteria bacterium HGW-Deltaproteobacteria-10]